MALLNPIRPRLPIRAAGPFDYGGAKVARGEGAECLHFSPGNTFCHEIAVMFIDNPNPAAPDQVAFSSVRDEDGFWDFGPGNGYWCRVGKGASFSSWQRAYRPHPDPVVCSRPSRVDPG